MTRKKFLMDFLTKNFGGFIKKIKNNLSTCFLFLLLLLFIVVFHKALFSIIAVLVMIILAAVSTLYKRITYISLGIELITFFTVIIAYVYGALAAVISTILMVLLSHLFLMRFDADLIAKVIVYIIIAIFAAAFSNYNIVVVGKLMAILMNVLFFVVFTFLWGFNPVTAVISITVNIALNFLLFIRYGEALLDLLT